MNGRLAATVLVLSTGALSGCAVYGDGRPQPAAYGSGYYYARSYATAGSIPYASCRYAPSYYTGRYHGRPTYVVTPPPRVVVRPPYDDDRDHGDHRRGNRHDADRDRHRRDDDHRFHPRADADRPDGRGHPGGDVDRRPPRGQAMPGVRANRGQTTAPVPDRRPPRNHNDTRKGRRGSDDSDSARRERDTK